MSALSLEEVERIAALARLDLTPDEKRLFARQLTDILSYAEQVQRIDTSGIAATAHVHPEQRVEREDEPVPSLGVEAALANAPDGDADSGLFKVPRVIG